MPSVESLQLGSIKSLHLAAYKQKPVSELSTKFIENADKIPIIHGNITTQEESPIDFPAFDVERSPLAWV